MIRSMTGFGRATFEVAGTAFALEVRTVNHRHLDVSVRTPRSMSGLDANLRKMVQARFVRGKVDAGLGFAAPGTASPGQLELDADVVARYLAFAERLHGQHGVEGRLELGTLLSLPGVARLVETSLPEEELERGLHAAAVAACDACRAMRLEEGAAIDRDLRGRLDEVARLVAELDRHTPEVVEAAKQRLRKRMEQVRSETGMLDEARVHQEIVIAADKLDVTEELVRLRSHVDQFVGVLDAADGESGVGRRLDFLIQEMVREANTIGSKCSDAGMAHLVVDLKTELERVREQAQNVE